MALVAPEVDLLGISCVNGNVVSVTVLTVHLRLEQQSAHDPEISVQGQLLAVNSWQEVVCYAQGEVP